MKGQRSKLTSTDEVISGRIWSGIHDVERIRAGGLYLYFICVLFGVSRLWRTVPAGLGGASATNGGCGHCSACGLSALLGRYTCTV